MEAVIRLAGHVAKFIIKKSMNMKTGEEKNKKKSGNASKIVGSLVAGAAVGLAAGILLAPDKGKNTRAKLMKDAEDRTDKLKDKANDGMELIADKK
ncbi:YtxH domain-containing protein [Fluviicola chungangensis]|nr:YtxH domain-containing protein [Fluviicola chungangensis]